MLKNIGASTGFTNMESTIYTEQIDMKSIWNQILEARQNVLPEIVPSAQ